ncbi:hypothetical protein SYJ56_13770 [Algoriphagus sp. D3-2-R+10]|uniref:hypothetical protein n=1 Tax=Algoriphagus aurantiacus TaxID=3103948 RepID=UPI002B3C925F|nr:hypothetical protein [Algoriphagus sp. D3-2-R+10]MEB2776385.1 hypothetical protein [Algoriphagus sp. D3-2-R+10]
MKNILASIIIATLAFIFLPKANAQKLGEKLKNSAKEVINSVEKLSAEKIKQRISSGNKKPSKDNEEDYLPKLNPEDFVVLQSESDDFQVINIQKHNGLPRIGAINSFGKYTSRNYDYNKEMVERINEFERHQRLYFQMVRAKYKSDALKGIDKNILYKKFYPQNEPEKQYKLDQYGIQTYLQDISYNTLSEKGKEKYFVNTNAGYGGSAITWGGRDADEFRVLEIYKEFTKNNLDHLINWSNSFLPDDQLEFYYVNACTLDNYDFEKQGYAIVLKEGASHIDINSISLDSKFKGDIRKDVFGTHVGQNEFEFNVNEEPQLGYAKLLLEISPDKAESLKEELSYYGGSPNNIVVFMVRKVKMEPVKKRRTLASQNTPQDTQEQEFSYSFSEQIAEVYSDEGLTNKIGSIKLYNTDEEQKLANDRKVQNNINTENEIESAKDRIIERKKGNN